MSDNSKICPHCGSSVMADANFCPRCGTDLRPEGSEPSIKQTPDSATPPENPSPPPEPRTPSRETRPAASPASPPEVPTDTTLGSLSGLLDPMGVSSQWGDEITPLPDRRAAANPAADELRRVRYRMLQEPTLAPLVQPIPLSHGVYRVYWLFGLLALALLVPFLLPSSGPTEAVQPEWGVVQAYQAINSPQSRENVLIFWAYDPATAGEMDQVVYPVIRHLLQNGAHMTIVTLLPGGVASAERLIAEVVANDSELKQGDAAAMSQLVSLHFVPGGMSALPWIGRTSCSSDTCRRTASEDGFLAQELCPGDGCNFQLAIVVTAQLEDGQQWLEMAQPLNNLNVVIVSSAVANLAFLPYLNSGQLAGLVGGFDGAAAYLNLHPTLLSAGEWSARWQMLYQLRWGHIALIVVIFLGNLVALGNSSRAEPGANRSSHIASSRPKQEVKRE